ncbi:MAG: hypothetical protein R3Y64_08545 [Peptostreptococcaceae bacterium]
MYKLSKYFEEAINTNDDKKIKVAVCCYIDKDPSDRNFELKSIIDFLDENNKDIWEEHIIVEEDRPKDEWDEDYLALLQADLMFNFSKDRLNHIMDVGQVVIEGLVDIVVVDDCIQIKEANIVSDESINILNSDIIIDSTKERDYNKNDKERIELDIELTNIIEMDNIETISNREEKTYTQTVNTIKYSEEYEYFSKRFDKMYFGCYKDFGNLYTDKKSSYKEEFLNGLKDSRDKRKELNYKFDSSK